MFRSVYLEVFVRVGWGEVSLGNSDALSSDPSLCSLISVLRILSSILSLKAIYGIALGENRDLIYQIYAYKNP